jgi:hypothetical protein
MEDPLPDGEIRAGREWAQCARDVGVGLIGDPDALGYVFIPPELTLAQAEILGKECSAPMAEDEYWPQLDVAAGVVGPDGLRDRTRFSKLLNGPFIDSDNMSGAEPTDGE